MNHYDIEEGPCDICGKNMDECECPACPVCGEVGNLACLKAGGHWEMMINELRVIAGLKED